MNGINDWIVFKFGSRHKHNQLYKFECPWNCENWKIVVFNDYHFVCYCWLLTLILCVRFWYIKLRLQWYCDNLIQKMSRELSDNCYRFNLVYKAIPFYISIFKVEFLNNNYGSGWLKKYYNSIWPFQHLIQTKLLSNIALTRKTKICYEILSVLVAERFVINSEKGEETNESLWYFCEH